jgi:predicted porin
VKKILLSSVAILAFATIGRADELSDIKDQAKQLREQVSKRLVDLEKRQKALEAQKPTAISPVDAMAADLPYKAAVKAKPPENDDICIKGICIYGNFDMGVTYMTHGAPLVGMFSGGLDTLVGKNASGPYFGAGPSQISSSFIGLRGKQEIADNLYAVFNLQTIFDPASGMNTNGTGSVSQNNGLTSNVLLQNAYGDSSKAGQMFNNAAYFGVSSPTYGTFTMGRQSALSSDLVTNYDAMSGSNAFSVLTYQGANGGGGDTENRIYDNSYEYRLNIGSVRLAVEAQLRNGGNSTTGNAFEGNIGFDYMGLSMDFVGGKVYDALAASPLSAAQVQTATALGLAVGTGQIGGTISDNTVLQVAARYTIGPWKLFGGYEHIDYANPNNPILPGAFAQGGYIVVAPNNTNFTTDKVLQTAWAGVRYSITPNVDLTVAYYHEWQNSFVNASNPTGTCSTAAASSCSGTLDAVSLLIDWRFARHVDVYAGAMYSQITNGLASGALQANGLPNGTINPNGGNKANNFDPAIGLRYQF